VPRSERVDADDHLMLWQGSSRIMRLKNRVRGTLRSTDPLFHFFELPRTDAHTASAARRNNASPKTKPGTRIVSAFSGRSRQPQPSVPQSAASLTSSRLSRPDFAQHIAAVGEEMRSAVENFQCVIVHHSRTASACADAERDRDCRCPTEEMRSTVPPLFRADGRGATGEP